MKESKLRLIITGGTFDKQYDAIKGTLDFKDTHLPGILEITRPAIDIGIEKCILIDSLEMKEEHRERIYEVCRDAAEEMIVITHGTDTMTETASYLGKRMETGLSGKTIVLTGAMVPYSVSNSDALFNLGTAFASAQLLDPGVYISMNARIFSWENVRKNREIGRFEEITEV